MHKKSSARAEQRFDLPFKLDLKLTLIASAEGAWQSIGRMARAECLESSEPIEVTRHGQTIGFYVSVPAKSSQSSREALLAAGRRMDAELRRAGITEDEILADFKHWRKRQHAK